MTDNTVTQAHIKSTAIEGKRPRVLFHYAADLQLEHDHEPVEQVDAKAMPTKLWLHLASTEAESRFGYFFSGISTVFVEKYCFKRIIMLYWCLLTTTSFEMTILLLLSNTHSLLTLSFAIEAFLC